MLIYQCNNTTRMDWLLFCPSRVCVRVFVCVCVCVCDSREGQSELQCSCSLAVINRPLCFPMVPSGLWRESSPHRAQGTASPWPTALLHGNQTNTGSSNNCLFLKPNELQFQSHIFMWFVYVFYKGYPFKYHSLFVWFVFNCTNLFVYLLWLFWNYTALSNWFQNNDCIFTQHLNIFKAAYECSDFRYGHGPTCLEEIVWINQSSLI